MAKKTTGTAHVIRRLEQVRVLAHPLRLRLLEAFARGPKTTKQAADLLGLPPTRLYHHAQALERAGLIRLKETRPNRGTIEKHYEAIAEQVSLDPDVFRGPAGRRLRGTSTVLAGRVFDLAKADLAACLSARESGGARGARGAGGGATAEERLPLTALRMSIRATPKRLSAIHRQLMRWIERVKRDAGGDEPAGDCRDASLTIAFIPSPPPANPAARSKKAGAPRPARTPSSRKES